MLRCRELREISMWTSSSRAERLFRNSGLSPWLRREPASSGPLWARCSQASVREKRSPSRQTVLPPKKCKTKRSSARFQPRWGVWLGPPTAVPVLPLTSQQARRVHVHARVHLVSWRSTREEPDPPPPPSACLHGHVCVWTEMAAAAESSGLLTSI